MQGTWVFGAAYSRPKHPKEHKKMLEDIATDIAILRQDEDVIGICLGGDLNTRLGLITGDHRSSGSKRVNETCYMLSSSSMALCTSTQGPNKRYTCKKGTGLGSINDFLMFSTDLQGNKRRSENKSQKTPPS